MKKLYYPEKHLEHGVSIVGGGRNCANPLQIFTGRHFQSNKWYHCQKIFKKTQGNGPMDNFFLNGSEISANDSMCT